MFNNAALDVFIGLVFIFLLYSLLATLLQEIIATQFAFRAKILEKAIIRMLEDGKTSKLSRRSDRFSGLAHLFGLKNILKKNKVATWFYAHPLIKYLGEDNYYSKPSYLDASNFSKVMLDLFKGFGQPESRAVQSIHDSITAGVIHKLPINIAGISADKANPAIKILRKETDQSKIVNLETNTALFFRSLWQDSGADINVFKAKLEQWFNDTMDRTTGWYKKSTQFVLFFIGLIIAVGFNVDTIAIYKVLSTNKTARQQMVQMAISKQEQYGQIIKNIDSSGQTGVSVPQGKLLKEESDSFYNETNRLLQNDASASNSILGLQRSWLDSCKICDSVSKCGDKTSPLYKKLDSLKVEKIVIEFLKKDSDNIAKEKSTTNSLLKKVRSKAISDTIKQKLALLNSWTLDNDSLSKLHNPQGLIELEKLNHLNQRCQIIQQRKWFQFSPNQSGGCTTLIGWLIAAFAITLGAPFWFDILSKLITLRGSGTKITSPDDDSTKKADATAPVNPVTVNVNPSSSEEAVG